MRELSLHILDIIQNSITAQASEVSIDIRESIGENLLVMEIKDNGRGMPLAQAEKAIDPFATSRTTREVGLGLSLLEAAARRTDGYLELDSIPGKGTVVKVKFTLDHLDRAPLGDITGTLISLLAANERLKINYRHQTDSGQFYFNTGELRQELGGIPLNHPRVLNWLEGYIDEALAEIRHNVEVIF